MIDNLKNFFKDDLLRMRRKIHKFGRQKEIQLV